VEINRLDLRQNNSQKIFIVVAGELVKRQLSYWQNIKRKKSVSDGTRGALEATLTEK